jgi:hypothetical protein
LTDNTTYGWTITKDYCATDRHNRVGYGQTISDTNDTIRSFDRVVGRTLFVHDSITPEQIEQPVRWRAFGDSIEGEETYDGVVRWDWLMGISDPEGSTDTDDLAYNIDRFCMEDAGATHVFYSVLDIATHCPPERGKLIIEWLARHEPVTLDDGMAYIEIYG